MILLLSVLFYYAMLNQKGYLSQAFAENVDADNSVILLTPSREFLEWRKRYRDDSSYSGYVPSHINMSHLSQIHLVYLNRRKKVI